MSYEQFVQRFLLFVLCSVFLIGSISYALYTLNSPYTENDMLLQYQLTKLATTTDTRVVIVGDSSAGNAISAEIFSKQVGLPTLNVALTGSYGIEGSYNMLRQSLRAHPEIQYVLIVQSLDVWRRPFSEQGVLDTQHGLSACAFRQLCTHPLALAKYLFNPKEILWAGMRLVSGPPTLSIYDDFIQQQDATYRNGALSADTVRPLSTTIDPTKHQALVLIGQLCQQARLSCVYVNGPLHTGVVEKSTTTIAQITSLVGSVPGISTTTLFPVLSADTVGDSLDHVDATAKAETSRWYARTFLDLIKPSR